MTILISASRAAALVVDGGENNPFVTGANLAETESPTLTTPTGTVQTDGDEENATSGTTYDFWVAAPATGAVTWQAAFSADVSPTFAGIAAHNLADISGSVRVEYSTDGVSWTDCGCGSETPADNQAIGFRFAPVAADFWRVRITGASDNVAIGVIWIGTEIIIPRRLYQGYVPPLTPTNVDRISNVSEGGHAMGTAVVKRGSSAQASITYVSPTFLRGSTWKAFQTLANDGGRFFWAWRPQKYGDLFYSWLTSGSVIQPENSGPRDLMSINLGMRFYDDP